MKLRHKIYVTYALMVIAGALCFSNLGSAVANLPLLFGLDTHSLFIGAVYFFLSIGIMEYFVLFRIEQLQKDMEIARTEGYSKQKIYRYSNDELGSIANNINLALEELESQRQRLKTKNNLYMSLVNDKSIYAYRFKSNGEITFINKTFADQFGRNDKSLVGQNLYDFFESTGFNAEGMRKSIALLNPSNLSSNIIYDIPRVLSEEAPKWIAWTISAAFNEKGVPTEYQVVGINIHGNPAAFIDDYSIHKSTILLNKNGKIDYMFSWLDDNEGIGEDLLDYIHEADRWVVQKAISRTLTHRDESLVNARIKIKDEFVYVQMAVNCSVDKENQIKNVVIHTVDITEIQGAQEKVVGAVNDMHKILTKRF